MDFLEKCKRFTAYCYSCEVPPVCPSRWTTEDWIKWIDSTGKWFDLPDFLSPDIDWDAAQSKAQSN